MKKIIIFFWSKVINVIYNGFLCLSRKQTSSLTFDRLPRWKEAMILVKICTYSYGYSRNIFLANYYDQMKMLTDNCKAKQPSDGLGLFLTFMTSG